ncbi:glycoside hydrolase family 6 protein [Microtetraspora malaysiensis]|uniref:glycoside hydrolase family 6 protein n=1 Tax=Microtetraspora malaysiensis TaxID=161358 RepID=UPI00082C5A3E|nr:glycoside hydrolase family 6 protein [Microtetraspora malaysiensis]
MTNDDVGEPLRDGDPREAGGYPLLRRLGQGGMGTVYLGRAPGGDPVAVKLIHPQWAADPDFRRRFTREISAAQRVARFCTAPVLAADVEGDTAYLVTEYVPGPTLQQAVRDHGPLTGASLEAVAVNVAVALRAIHDAGVVHRDLKPANVILSPVGPKVIDFGIAQLAEAGAHVSSAIVGTPAYMPPEQARGEHVTPASDIFAWGALVAYAASGHAPFGDGPPPSVLYRVAHHEPNLTALEPGLRATVAHALAKDPAHRPTAQQLLDTLTRPAADVRTGGETDAVESTEGGTALSRQRRKRVVAGTAVAALVTAGVLIATQAPQAREGQGETARSTAARATPSGEPSPPLPSPGATGATGAGAQPGGHPLAGDGVRFYVAPDGDAARQASIWKAAGRGGDAALMRALARVPQAVWLDRLTPAEAAATVTSVMGTATPQGTVPVLVTDHIPLRICEGGEDGGAADSAGYLAWIDAIATAIGDHPAVVILEPNSLVMPPGSRECDRDGPEEAEARFRDVAAAVDRLGELPRTAVYLDGGVDGWPDLRTSALRLIRAGVDRTAGFYLNVYDHQPTRRLTTYGTKLSKCLQVMTSNASGTCTDAELDAVSVDPPGLAHFVIDTARNGRGAWRPPAGKYADPQEWCNPPERGAGVRPTTDTANELADAYLWIRPPGASSGACTRGGPGPEDPAYGTVAPHFGAWWDRLALERARNAVPPLR